MYSCASIDDYKDSFAPVLVSEFQGFFYKNYDKLAINDDQFELKNLTTELQQLLFLAKMCSLQVDSTKKEKIASQIPICCDDSLTEQFFTALAKTLCENPNQQNIIFASIIISLLSNNKDFYSHAILLDIIKHILSNLQLLTPKQISQLNFNFILKIIRYQIKHESDQSKFKEFMPLELILSRFSQLSDSFFSKYILEYLKYLNTFCSYPHSQEEGKMIFEEITKLRNKMTINYHYKYLCSIIISMINFQTLPIDLFTVYEYQNFLHDIIFDKNNIGVIEHALYLIGLCTLNNIIAGFYDVNFFLRILSEHHMDNIRIMVLWNLSIGLSDEICHFLIEKNFLNYLTKLYKTCSFKLKHEITSLLTNMMCITSDPPEIFLSVQIIEILLDSMMTFDDNDIFKTGFTLYQTIEDYAIINQDENEMIENLKKILNESNIKELIEHLEESDNELNNQLALKFKEFICIDNSNEE